MRRDRGKQRPKDRQTERDKKETDSQQTLAPSATEASGRRRHQRNSATAPGLCHAGAPTYLHRCGIKEFLRAASGAAIVQRIGSGPGCGVTSGPPEALSRHCQRLGRQQAWSRSGCSQRKVQTGTQLFS